MKIAIISDTHLGDPKSTMASKDGVGIRYPKFRSIIKENLGSEIDYLVLLGDVMDFAVSSYQEAYEAGKRFFIQLKNDRIAKQIIYVPGMYPAIMILTSGTPSNTRLMSSKKLWTPSPLNYFGFRSPP